MKKYFISGAMLAGLMSLAACSNDEGVVADNNGAEQQFTITLASSGDRATRAAADRTLESEAAGQSIEKVTLVVRSQDDGEDKNKVVYIHTLDNWNDTATDYDTNGHGKKLTFTIPKADKLGAGSYVVTAVGYNEGNYNLKWPAKGEVLDKNITATTLKGAEAKEVFAGEQKFTVKDGKIDETDGSKAIKSVDVTLHRQVAGAYGYFTSIPAKIGETDVASIRMVSRSKNTVLTFGSFNSLFTTDANVMYMVNGSVPATKTAKFLNGDEANVLFSAQITDWFPGGDKNNDGVYDKKDTNWTKHYSGSYLKGSVFASNFIVPFSATQGKSTLELQLLDATGNVLYAWPVKLDTSNDQIGKTGETASANLSDPSTTMGFAETADVFSLFRNHIYSIGIHKQDTTNPDKTEPGTDEPTDLSKIQNVVIRVNDNWEALHHMSIDE